MSSNYGTANAQVDTGTHWLTRIVAAIIDSIPWAIIGYVIWYVLIMPGGPLVGALGPWAWLVYTFLAPIFYGLLFVIYCAIMESSASAATFGKKLMGLKVQMLDGSKAPSNKIWTRNISKIFWIIFLIDFLIGIATPGPDPRQRYFDRIAGTTVVSIKQVFTAASPPPPPPPPPA